MPSTDLIRHSDQAALSRDGVSDARFRELYRDGPPWEIGRPQPEVVRLEDTAAFGGEVLDVGCGTGDNAIFLASRGHRVVAIDFVEEALNVARGRAASCGLPVEFVMHDALRLDSFDRNFDTMLDCATFHGFSDRERPTYARALHAAARPNARLNLICFSDLETRQGGPRRVSIREIWRSFGAHWEVVSVRPSRYLATFFSGGACAWTAQLRRR